MRVPIRPPSWLVTQSVCEPRNAELHHPIASSSTMNPTDRIPRSDLPHYAFLLSWPFDQRGGVNHVLQNLLDKFQQSGRFAPIAVEVFGDDRLPGPVPSPHAYPTVRASLISAWDAPIGTPSTP